MRGFFLCKKLQDHHRLRGTYDEGPPADASDYESGYLKRILAFIGITDVEVILATPS